MVSTQMASRSVQLQAICGRLAMWCVDPVAWNANLRLSPPRAFAIHHFHIQMAPIVFLVLFCAKCLLSNHCILVLKQFYYSSSSPITTLCRRGIGNPERGNITGLNHSLYFVSSAVTRTFTS